MGLCLPLEAHLRQLFRCLAGECTQGKQEEARTFSTLRPPEEEGEVEAKPMVLALSHLATTLLFPLLQISLREVRALPQEEMPKEPNCRKPWPLSPELF